MINAEILKHSTNTKGKEVISFILTFPRIILSEFNTHRSFSRNTSSSRAIPFKKMSEAVTNNPFIPIAWQKHHSGMQGREYLDPHKNYSLAEFVPIIKDTLTSLLGENSNKNKSKVKDLEFRLNLIETILKPYKDESKNLIEWWLFARDKAVECASLLYIFDVSKQLCNRLLEPFMWCTVVMTTSKEGLENFFELRCPRYEGPYETFKSWKKLTESYGELYKDVSLLERLENNSSDAEIHISLLAEQMYDAYNESTSQLLNPGEWHIPFEDKMDLDSYFHNELSNEPVTYIKEMEELVKIKTSVSMCARTSYTVVGDEKEVSIGKHLSLHDDLVSREPLHASPLENVLQATDDDSWNYNVCGFKSYRYLLEKENFKI